MRFVGQQGIQVHGGIGITNEYAASRDFKRLAMTGQSFGDSLHPPGEVSRRMPDSAGGVA